MSGVNSIQSSTLADGSSVSRRMSAVPEMKIAEADLGFAERKRSFMGNEDGEDMEFNGSSKPSKDISTLSAITVLRRLAPTCAPSVMGRLRRERIRTAVDLAGLDKDDLRELGLTMVERSKVLRWARTFNFTSCDDWQDVAQARGRTLGFERPDRSSSIVSSASDHYDDVGSALEQLLLMQGTPGTPGAAVDKSLLERISPTQYSDQGLADIATALNALPVQSETKALQNSVESEDEVQRHLDEIEQRSDFWCALISSASCCGCPATAPMTLQSSLRSDSIEEVSDLRENVLEDLFDITEERVAEIYGYMYAQGSARVGQDQLALGLRKCGLPAFPDDAIQKVHSAVASSPSDGLRLSEFETVLTRLKLAQLLVGGGADLAVGEASMPQLAVVDYNAHGAKSCVPIGPRAMREFFFGHREQPKQPDQANMVRWINLCGMNMTLLLSLMVKYGLHPLGVEDVIEQCPTKMDCYGGHYFTGIEQLSLAAVGDGSTLVRVRGCHVSVFCSGPPLFDTVITVTQPDRSFAEDWPRDEALEGGIAIDSDYSSTQDEQWVTRLRSRLQAQRSRLRERRADFLMHQVIDLCTDELVSVVRAYTLRLGHIDGLIRKYYDAVAAYIEEPEWLQEVSLILIQLSVVARRIRGLHRVLRHVVEDQDLTAGLSSYLQDVKDHLDEAQEDTAHLREKCEAMIDSYERAMEREQEKGRERAADRLNMTLFTLTVVSAILSPLQFLAGVYGMNFQGEDGKPSIPELKWKYGYASFWIVVIVYLFVAGISAAFMFRRMRRKKEQDTGRIRAVQDRGGTQSPRPLKKPWNILTSKQDPVKKENDILKRRQSSMMMPHGNHGNGGHRTSLGLPLLKNEQV